MRSLKQTAILQIFIEQDKQKLQLHKLIAVLWQSIESKAIAAELIPNDEEIDNYTKQFCYKNKISSQEEMNTWLEENDLMLNEFKDLMSMAIRFDFIVMGHNVDVLGISFSKELNWWLVDALRLTGLYADAKRLLVDTKYKEDFLSPQKLSSIITDEYAYYHDFEKGEVDVKDFIHSLQDLKQGNELLEKA